TVSDAAKAPVAGAALALSGPVSRSATTGKDGSFSFAGLPLGTYQLSVTKGGFQSLSVSGIEVGVSPGTPLALTLAQASLANLRQIGEVSVNRKTALNTSPAAVASVGINQYIQQSQEQINGLLDQLPGVELNRFSSGTPGANTAVAIRGAATYETQDLIDGHPVSTGTDGDYLTNFLNAFVFQSVDVDKGPGALPNTIANAVGGTVNFVTPSISATPTGMVLAGYDSFNGSFYGVLGSDTIGKVGFLVDVARFGTPGYASDLTVPYVNTYIGNQNYLNNPTPSVISGGITVGQTYDNKAQVLKLDYNFSPTTTLTLGNISSQTFNDESGTLTSYNPSSILPCIDTNDYSPCGSNPTYPVYNNPAFASSLGKTVNGFFTYGPEYETNNEPLYTADFRTGLGNATALLRYYAGSIYRTINQLDVAGLISTCGDPACTPANATFLTPYLETQNDLLHGFDAEIDEPLGPHLVTFGIDRHTDVTTSCQGNPFQTGGGFGSYNCLNAFGNVSDTTQQSFTYSLRGHFQLSNRAHLDLGNYLSDATFIGTRYDPRMGFTYRLGSNAILRASYGSTYVLPYAGTVTQEPYVYQKTFHPASAALLPETSAGYDLGADYGIGRFGKISLDAFETHVFNRFTTATNPVTGEFNGTPYTMQSQTFNVSNAREAGLELSVYESPPVGLGFDGFVDLDRSYAYHIPPSAAGNSNGPYQY
ncbi:MAG: TonB-dependent receptor domain-containing protein, partial [Acidimicrobiales bacterium]